MASGSCLCALLVCILLLSTRGLPLVSVSWDVFSRPSVCSGVFSLVFLAFVSVGLRPVSVWSCFWASCPFGCWGSRFSLPLAVFRVYPHCLCSYLFQGFFWIGWFRLTSSSVVFRRLLLFIGLLWVGRTVLFLFSSLSFWSVLGGAALRVFLLLAFGHLSASPFVLSPCPLVFSLLLVVCSCLLSPVGQWVLQGLRVLACPCLGGLFPGLSLFCVFGLYQFGSLPSFLSCSSGVLRPGGCSFP